MSMSVQNRQFAGRLVRNLVVAIAVTAIFGFKAAEINDVPINADQMTLAAR